MRGFLNHQQRSRHRQWGLCGGGGPSAARGGVLLLKVLLVATVLAAAVRAAAGKQVASSTTSVAVSAPERGVVTASAASAQGKRVVALSSKDFFSKLKDGQPLLVSFIAPSWCVHCVRLLPILEALAYEVRDERVTIATVDCDEHKALANLFRVRSYPHILYIGDGPKKGLLSSFVRSVRPLPPEARSMDMMARFIRGGWKDAPPIPWFRGPFGPIGLAKALLLRAGLSAHAVAVTLIERGYSSWSIGFLMVTLGSLLTLLAILIVTFVLSTREKRD